MPPRIQTQWVSNSVLPYLSPNTSTSVSSSSSSSCTSLPSSTSCPRRTFSSTPAAQTRLRSHMFEWLNSEGRKLQYHEPNVYKYVTNLKDLGKDSMGPEQLSKRPFPLNQNFVSEPILSEEMRAEIYKRVTQDKKSVRAVSIELKVDMRRVAAVVRLMEMEKAWRSQGKPLALPYARAIQEMVPTTRYSSDPRDQRPHESINDLPVHRLTDPQIFYPVSESRQFTRVDAGRVFSGAPRLPNSTVEEIANDPSTAISKATQKPHLIERVGKGDQETQVLQPADARIPHPYLVAHERDSINKPNERNENIKRFASRLQEEERIEAERKQATEQRRENRTRKVNPEDSRFEFRFTDVVVSKETTGADGRGHKAPGRRYGVPSYERKKGQVKIPTRVNV
ncbi:hypothetical protein SI65_09146 [Aspergillus cristatus]|uniref:Eukaryotic mitochondrial regulator protein-domain-containing protein n=1 Tax=Aspergillus cristatus TaxID=573508 RepID=A0A1E3B3L9_ASPCR|nr:hypothetical protein SI65_09146 [Aspergillus cristatus]